MRSFWIAAAAGMSLAAVMGPGARPASADAPTQAGWWWQGNPGAVPMVGVSVTPPPPDVPPDGLLIQGGSSSTSDASNSGPTAYGALLFSGIPDGARVSTLTLTVGSVASTPNATLQICPVSSSWFRAEYGGPVSEAPSFDCTTNDSAAPSASGETYEFSNVGSMVDDGELAIVVLPTSPTDRVVLSAPDENSLLVTPSFSAGSSSTGGSSGSTGGFDGTTGASSSGSSPSSGGVTTSRGRTASPSLATPQPSTRTPSSNQASAPSTAARTTDGSQYASSIPTGVGGGGAEPLAVGSLIGLALVGSGMWSAAGRAAARAAVQVQP